MISGASSWARMTISNERLMGLRLADEQNRVNKKGGMPAFEPTAEQREIVERAAG
jgi:hypothetical protein